MKKTVLIMIMVVAMIVGVVAYATAASPETVTVTAKVNPAFSMTINKNIVDFGTLDPGTDPAADSSTSIQVKSNKPWDFSKSSVVEPMLAGLLTEGTSIAPATGLGKGVTDITVTYDLDLTPDAAYQLDPGTAYSNTYTYTAVQP